MTVLLTGWVGDNAPMFAAVMRQYVPAGALVVDLTWGRGRFWAETGGYRVVSMDSEMPAAVRGDLMCAPFATGSVDAVVLDPPYANNGGAKADGVSRTYNLPAGNSTKRIWRLYEGGMKEAARMLRPGGHLLVKCQDAIEANRQWRTTIRVWEIAAELGLEDMDQFVLVGKRKPIMRHPYQIHARKSHSVLWVFRRK